MRILLATDAWEPQVNGVVRTLTRVVAELRDMGDAVERYAFARHLSERGPVGQGEHDHVIHKAHGGQAEDAHAETQPGNLHRVDQAGNTETIGRRFLAFGFRRRVRVIETAPATPREAGPLRVDVGTPMLIVRRRNFDSAGTTVEFGRTWFRSDRVTLVTRLASEQR